MIKISKKADRDFIILNLTDPQLTEGDWGLNEDSNTAEKSEMFKTTVNELLTRVTPDLITITGDLAYPYHMRSYEKYAEFFDKIGIPWTVIWGNHDNEIDLEPIDEMVKILSKSKHFIFEEGPRELGSGNFVIAVEEEGKIVEGLIMMDTHDVLFYLPHEDTEQTMIDKNVADLMPTHRQQIEAFEKRGYTEKDVHWMNTRMPKKQIEWYSEQIEMLKSLGCNDTALFIHVPFHAYAQAFKAAFRSKLNPLDISVEDSYKGDCWIEGYKDSFGVKHEKNPDLCGSVGCYSADDGVFDAILEGGTTKTVVAGHCHTDNFVINYKGVKLAFALKTGPGCYWKPDLNGGTVIKIDSNGVKDLYHEYVNLD